MLISLHQPLVGGSAIPDLTRAVHLSILRLSSGAFAITKPSGDVMGALRMGERSVRTISVKARVEKEGIFSG